MPEFEWPGIPEHASLRRALRHGLRRHEPSLRVIAENFLAESSAIDLLAVGSEGQIVSIRIGDAGRQTQLFTQGLADLTWLRPRTADLIKLAPHLGLEPSAEPRAMIFCEKFSPETRAAAENLPTQTFELFEYRCVRQRGQLVLLLEPCRETVGSERRGKRGVGSVEPAHASRSVQTGTAAPGPEADLSGASFGVRSPTDHGSPRLGFRTGLCDADLRLEPTPVQSGL
jgi:hypothetical protein